MITDIYFPVIDTISGNYDHASISNEVYDEMIGEYFNRTNHRVDRFVFNLDNGIPNLVSNLYGNRRQDSVDIDVNEGYQYYASEARLTDSKNNEVTEEFFDMRQQNGGLCIIKVNINPATLDMDAQSELRYWKDESIRVHRDYTLDDKTKLLNLPMRNIKVKISDKKFFTLHECKMIQDYSDKRFPFSFALLVDKVTL